MDEEIKGPLPETPRVTVHTPTQSRRHRLGNLSPDHRHRAKQRDRRDPGPRHAFSHEQRPRADRLRGQETPDDSANHLLRHSWQQIPRRHERDIAGETGPQQLRLAARARPADQHTRARIGSDELSSEADEWRRDTAVHAEDAQLVVRQQEDTDDV